MMEDIKKKKINCIICKDLSRFGRNYVDSGRYLEKIFPFMGIRFVAINDNYDSNGEKSQQDSLIVPFKNLINDAYCRDISVKIRSQLDIKRKMGDFIGAFTTYGYKKDSENKNKLVIDEEAARIVEYIFNQRIDGMCNSKIAEKLDGKNFHEIARGLNSDNIPSPGKLRYIRGQKAGKVSEDNIWLPSAVKRILKNPTYLGDLVFGRKTKALYLGQPNAKNEPDESKWRVLHDMHPALIDRENFEKIKAEMDKSAKAYIKKTEQSKKFREKHPPVFSHIHCGDCGANLYYMRYKTKSEKNYAAKYYCHNKEYKRCESMHSIREDKLSAIVGSILSDHIAMFADIQNAVEKMKDTGYTTKRQQAMDKEINNIVAQLQKRQRNRETLYEDYADGILSAEDYIYHKQKYDDECRELSSRLNVLEVERRKLSKTISEDNSWLKNIKPLLKAKKVTREIAEAFVENITVYDDNGIRVEVKLKYADELETLVGAIKEMEVSK